MSLAQAAAGPDRLPWLSDEPSPPEKRGNNREAAGWAVAATLLVAAASYWMGAHSGQPTAALSESAKPTTTVPLPEARSAEPQQPQVVFEPAPQVSPAPQRETPMATPRIERRSTHARPPSRAPATREPTLAVDKQATASTSIQVPAPQSAKPAPGATDKPLAAWPASQSQGAYGRLVRIGAFGSRQQAKLGWRYMVLAYPAVAHLQATVVEVRNSRGHPFYRFQIGTTSQAHSEVLCQRMEKIRLSCAVVGLPWKPKGVER